ncbi:GAF and ANTAR domain-containing protein [Arthrobacter sp. SLBN-100]|uniref:GAF and ANTAR domain-containing protein n=1 Tax=Arthrobacter sp. SLBN-100 TaxID=2768450 RepID=UPI001F44EC59|nr:GAF and ANTAR domain-containing protein [Arthrobacter sp. SLBN-100]
MPAKADALPVAAAIQDGVVSRLQDLVLQTADAQDFFQELAVFSASLLAPPGGEVHCNVTVVRRKRPTTVASSSTRARVMDELQYAYGDGPCLAAIRTGKTIYVADVANEQRWPEYAQAVAAYGVGSILGVPLELDAGSSAALNIYSSAAHGFSPTDIARAELFGEQSAKTLKLELRLVQLMEAKEDLEAAMKSRTAIDIAVGVIMAQNRCSQAAAMDILRKASNSRNVKLRDVAAGVIESVSPDPALRTHFDE